MRRVLLVVLFLGLGLVWGQVPEELKGELEKRQAPEEVYVGDTFDAVLRLYPYPEAKFDTVRSKLNGEKIFNIFYIYDVGQMNFSPNNPEVLEIEIKVVLLAPLPEKEVYPWLFNERGVLLKIKNIQTVGEASKEKDLFIFNQHISKDFFWFGMVFLFVLVPIVGAAIYRSIKRKKQKNDIFLEDLKLIFRSAKAREDFENIYKMKEKWLEVTNGKTPPIQEFFDILNQVQFKRLWSENDLTRVTQAFDEIRGIFEYQSERN